MADIDFTISAQFTGVTDGVVKIGAAVKETNKAITTLNNTISANVAKSSKAFTDQAAVITASGKALADFVVKAESLDGIGKKIGDSTENFKTIGDVIDGLDDKINLLINSLKDQGVTAQQSSFLIVQSLNNERRALEDLVAQFLVTNDPEKVKTLTAAIGDQVKKVESLTAELEKVEAGGVTSKQEQGFIRLQKQIALADKEAQELGLTYGALDPRFISAAQKAADLKRELSDVRGTIDALNPEAKFRALETVATGLIGSFQTLTGAVQLFGGETEAIQALAQRLQGVLNFAQGVNSILALGGQLKNLGIVLGIYRTQAAAATVATEAQAVAAVTATTAIGTETVATEAATVATNTWTASLLANPITAIAVALAALTVGIFAYIKATEKAVKTEHELYLEQKRRQEEINQLQESQIKRDISNLERDVVLAKRAAFEKFKARKDSEENYNRELDKIERTRAETILANIEAAIKAGAEQTDELLKLKRDQQAKLLQLDEKAYSDERSQEEQQQAKRKAQIEKFAQELEALNKQLSDKFTQAILSNLTTKERIEAEKKIALEEIDKLIAEIEKRQGGALTGKQLEQVSVLIGDIEKRTNDALNDLFIERGKILGQINVQDAQAADLAQFEANINKRTDQLRKLGLTEVEIAKVVNKERAEINTKYQNQQLDEGEEFAKALVEQQALLKTDSVKAEEIRQRGILNVQIQFAEARLRALALDNSDQAALQKLQLENLINGLKNQLKALDTKQNDFSLSKLLGLNLTPDQENQFKEQVNGLVDNVRQIYGAFFAERQAFLEQQKADNQALIESLDEQIKATGEALTEQQRLQQAGYDSNVQGKQKELDALNAAKAKALEKDKKIAAEQEKLARQQIIIDTLQQASQLALAGAKIIQSESLKGPAGIITAIAALTLLTSAFLSFKKASADAAKPQFEQGGWIRGKSHREGGVDIEAEGGEFVTRKRVASKRAKLLEAINDERYSGLKLNDIAFLLDGTGVSINPEVSENLRNQRTIINNYAATLQMDTERMARRNAYHIVSKMNENSYVDKVKAAKSKPQDDSTNEKPDYRK